VPDGLFDRLKKMVKDPKKATDAVAGKGSTAGTIRARRDLAEAALADPSADLNKELRRRQSSDHNN
jgi:hypothetical protein